MCGRITQNLRSYDLGFYSKTQFCSLLMIPSKPTSPSFKPSRLSEPLQVRTLQAKSSGEAPILVNSSSSQQGDECEVYPKGSASVAGGIVALGKFDALHIGHRELAVQASKSGIPFLLSFVGMAEVLGWEPRPPVVAKCDRNRVLSSWAPYCGNVALAEYHIQFSSIRHLTPHQFVEKLAKELGVRGVVAGENYRFGYKAAGDASQLVKLCNKYRIGAYIVTSVMDDNRVETSIDSKDKGQVSSTRVCLALAKGNMEYVSKLLGRNHRVMLMLTERQLVSSESSSRMSAPKSCLLNLPPKEGLYENCSLFVDDDNTVVPCRVTIDTTHIHVESHKPSEWMQIPFQDYRLVGIEFGAS